MRTGKTHILSDARFVCALTLLWGLWCAPRLAVGSCGDYLVRGSDLKNQGQHRFMPSYDRAASASRMQESYGGPTFPWRPCSGPNCGRQPFSPVTPDVPVRPDRARESAMLLSLVQKPTEFTSFILPSNLAKPLAGHPLPLERPPRA